MAEAIVGPDDQILAAVAQATGTRLAERREMLATAESCTGGWIAKLVTDIPGSSTWFERGLVTYSNHSKQSLLGVGDETLVGPGAVSAQAVLAMAHGLLTNSEADWVIAVSGIAGPTGGSDDKPVGTVWIAWGGRDCAASASVFHFEGNRDAIRRSAVFEAFKNLLELIRY